VLTATAPTDPRSDDSPLTDAVTDSPLDGTALPSTVDAVLPCWTQDPDLWFAESPAGVEAAKALCVPCPVREACLAGALGRREPWGVWGGQLVVAGVVVPRKRPRGRPRKVDAAA
jgi:WhiB family redox-sensing transcriptional regulator